MIIRKLEVIVQVCMNAAVVKLLLALSFPAISPILYSASYDLPIMRVIDVLGMFDKIYSHETVVFMNR